MVTYRRANFGEDVDWRGRTTGTKEHPPPALLWDAVTVIGIDWKVLQPALIKDAVTVNGINWKLLQVSRLYSGKWVALASEQIWLWQVSRLYSGKWVALASE